MPVTASLLVLVYAISQAPAAGWTAFRTVAMLAAGVVLFVLFLASVTSLACAGLSQRKTSP